MRQSDNDRRDPSPRHEDVQAVGMERTMRRDCVPGDCSCDPRRIADSIREWFDERGVQVDGRGRLTDVRGLIADRDDWQQF
ncbi:hypothetical protein ACVBGC_11965 [Burkholderia stagnalis]